MEDEKPQSLICAIVAVDPTNDFSYMVCSVCEKTLSSPNSLCKFCKNNSFRPGCFGSKRLFRLLMSVASDTKVFRVICFDRAAKVLFGCSADEFFNFAKLHPFAATNVGKILEGELFRMTLSKPKNGNAEHLRVVSIVPLRSGFQSAIKSLKELYGVAC